jgi:hypothetical protein
VNTKKHTHLQLFFSFFSFTGMKNEFLLATVFVTLVTLTITLTGRLELVFVNVVLLAMYRAAIFTTPFILANKYSKEDQV